MNRTAYEDRVNSVRFKLEMAEYHLKRIMTFDDGDCLSRDRIVAATAEFEACMHCLHHCLDITGQAIAHRLNLGINPDRLYFSDVMVKLEKKLEKHACEELHEQLYKECKQLVEDANWLTAFVNYSKHHNLVGVQQQHILTLPALSLRILMVREFEYKDTTYSQCAYRGTAKNVFGQVRDGVERILSVLQDPRL
jgi:hypothetical protein